MKYVFFDIDGTIRGKSREITKRNREAICKLRENGHKAFLCTGRAPVSITQDILDVGFDGVISASGSNPVPPSFPNCQLPCPFATVL